MNPNDRTLQASSTRTFICQQAEGELLDYVINYAPILGTDTINASTWEHAGINTTDAIDTDTTTGITAGGTRGRYLLINTVVTTNGRQIVRMIKLHVTSEANAGMPGDY